VPPTLLVSEELRKPTLVRVSVRVGVRVRVRIEVRARVRVRVCKLVSS